MPKRGTTPLRPDDELLSGTIPIHKMSHAEQRRLLRLKNPVKQVRTVPAPNSPFAEGRTGAYSDLDYEERIRSQLPPQEAAERIRQAREVRRSIHVLKILVARAVKRRERQRIHDGLRDCLNRNVSAADAALEVGVKTSVASRIYGEIRKEQRKAKAAADAEQARIDALPENVAARERQAAADRERLEATIKLAAELGKELGDTTDDELRDRRLFTEYIPPKRRHRKP